MLEPTVRPGKLIIDGKELDAKSGETIDTVNPATGKVLTTLARAKQEDVDAAVRSARSGFEAWSKIAQADRAAILWKVGEIIMAKLDDLALLETVDTGKPITASRMVDVPRSADTFFYFAGWATKIHGETIPVRGPFLNYTVREPLGVIGAIIPWNFPLLMGARKVAAALAAERIGSHENVGGNIPFAGELTDHGQRHWPLAIQDRRHQRTRADQTRQIGLAEIAFDHMGLDCGDRIGQIDRVVDRLICRHQRHQHFEPICLR